MFFILFIAVGAALGYAAAPRVGADPMIGGALGAVGGLVGGALVKFLFPIILGLLGAAIGALILLFLFSKFRNS